MDTAVIPFGTLGIGFVGLLCFVRFVLIESMRSEVIDEIKWRAFTRGEAADLKQFDQCGGFWQQYFSLHKWTPAQFYPEVYQ